MCVGQTAWSDTLGSAFGPTELQDVLAAIARISRVVDGQDQPRPPSKGPVDR